MPTKTKITLEDASALIEIYGEDGSKFDATQTRFPILLKALEKARAAADLKTLFFELTSPSAPAEFTFRLTTADRVWEQHLQYAKNDKRLSMTWNGITGFWKEAEIEPFPALRTELVNFYADYQITKVIVSWA
jgi:hypothetical protein